MAIGEGAERARGPAARGGRDRGDPRVAVAAAVDANAFTEQSRLVLQDARLDNEDELDVGSGSLYHVYQGADDDCPRPSAPIGSIARAAITAIGPWRQITSGWNPAASISASSCRSGT